MDKFTKVTLLFLSAQLFIMGLIVSHLAYKLGKEEGKMEVYQSYADDGTNDGTCLVPASQGGCPDMTPPQNVPVKHPKHTLHAR